MLRNSWELVYNVLPRVSEMVFKGSSVPDLTKLGHLKKKRKIKLYYFIHVCIIDVRAPCVCSSVYQEGS